MVLHMNYLSFRIWIHLSWTNWSSRLLLSVPTWRMWIWRKSISTTALRKNDLITTLMFLFFRSCHMGSKQFFSGLLHTPLLVQLAIVNFVSLSSCQGEFHSRCTCNILNDKSAWNTVIFIITITMVSFGK